DGSALASIFHVDIQADAADGSVGILVTGPALRPTDIVDASGYAPRAGGFGLLAGSVVCANEPLGTSDLLGGPFLLAATQRQHRGEEKTSEPKRTSLHQSSVKSV